MAKGFVRGNEVTLDGKVWRTASGEDAHAATLECPTCHVSAGPDDPDPCLGRIPGAAGACCGHGKHVGYINWHGISAPPGWFLRAYVGTTPVSKGSVSVTESELYSEIDNLLKQEAEHREALIRIDGALQVLRYLVNKVSGGVQTVQPTPEVTNG